MPTTNIAGASLVAGQGFKPQLSLTVRRVGNGYVVNLQGAANMLGYVEKIAPGLSAVTEIVKNHFADAEAA